MAGLSDIHLFRNWELNSNPVSIKFSETLKMATKEMDNPFSYRPSSMPQCGTISIKLDQKQWGNIIDTLHEDFNFMLNQRIKANDLCKEINRYLERKCEEYCKKNNIDFIDWSRFASSKHEKNVWKVYYKDELICGAKVNCELVESATESSVKLELY